MNTGWIVVAIAWLVAPVVLGIALIVSRSNARRRTEALQHVLDTQAQPNTDTVAVPGEDRWLASLGVHDIKSLLVLGVELQRCRQRGELDAERYAELRTGWEAICSEQLRLSGLEPDSDEWHQRRDDAWRLFVEQQTQPPGLAPWRQDTLPQETSQPPKGDTAETVDEVEPATEDLVFDLEFLTESPAPVGYTLTKPPAVAVAASISTEVHKRVDAAPERPEAAEANRELSVPATTQATSLAQPNEGSFSFTPVEPGLFERLVETVSGWPRLAAPFLVQNVGWFVGAFCFIAGTIFLISYTTGFANALAVLGSLAVYTSLMFWAGYQMRKHRPDLKISSDVLLAIAMLLCPLNLSAATRLINLAFASTGLLVIAGSAALAVVVGTYFSALLAGGLMDRSLSRRHAQLFVALASIQLLVPWITQVSAWYWLAVTHLILLGLLAYGLYAFSNDWVRSIFVDRRQMAYYAAGLLVFAAVVSFAHLTWSFSAGLPRGYAAPFLMALGGALFFVDAALKSWVRQHVYLSSFTFALYAVSILALLLSRQTGFPHLLTLALGVLIYGYVLLRYLTPPPLYLVLGCLGWLFASTVLEALPREWHLLASFPVLGGLLYTARWIFGRAPRLTQICLWVFVAGFALVMGWTLLGSQPGWLAFISAVVAALFVRYAARAWPLAGELVDEHGDFLHWRYVLALVAGVSVAYAPTFMGELQLAFALVGLAGVWTMMAFYSSVVSRGALEAHSNSALIALALSVAFSIHIAAGQHNAAATLVALYTAIGVVLIRLSVGFMTRWLFNLGLAALGASCVLIKLFYFPGISFGLTEFVAAFAVWGGVWWLNRSVQIESTLRLGPVATTRGIEARLLWTIPVERRLTTIAP